MALKIDFQACRSFSDWIALSEKFGFIEQNLSWEIDFSKPFVAEKKAFGFPGFCTFCKKDTTFVLNDWRYSFSGDTSRAAVMQGQTIPCWRELLRCSSCGLSSRMRASVHFVERMVPFDAVVHIAEQVCVFSALTRRYPLLIGSEFFQNGVPKGGYDDKLRRNEDITDLSFPNDSLGAALSFDVLEHVPNYKKAFSEAVRVLKPGGKIIFTAPFSPHDEKTAVRATIDETGKITHLCEPDYHESATGPVLCYQIFGWDILENMRQAGFSDAAAYLFWDPNQGFLGPKDYGCDIIFMGIK